MLFVSFETVSSKGFQFWQVENFSRFHGQSWRSVIKILVDCPGSWTSWICRLSRDIYFSMFWLGQKYPPHMYMISNTQDKQGYRPVAPWHGLMLGPASARERFLSRTLWIWLHFTHSSHPFILLPTRLPLHLASLTMIFPSLREIKPTIKDIAMWNILNLSRFN